ncbi:hypothetical protein FNF31_05022 [Cafeteria roenbergensis]|uniref:Peptidase M20 dimerisation domain-containing protein n=1 Tax=Cafeteria roenbergensis TaxID=33653 RepID=A0A5A8D477_CAFRO|nr:hypothetical protein FNF31_05022 [Cafeteria roenbergensis]
MATPVISKGFVDSIVKFRRNIHSRPETGFKEADTSAAILAELKTLGIPDSDIRVMAGTGIVADIRGTAAPIGSAAGSAGAAPAEGAPDGAVVIALRADMDALPMTEDTGDLPWASSRPGAAHMCGHDGHMANLLGVARLVAARRDRLPSDRVLRMLWQPAEEGPGGAAPMVAEGAMTGVAEVYGFHNWPTFPLGNAQIVAGPAMAHVTDFDVTVNGRGGHASAPHVLADPVLAASHCVVALQSIVSRCVPASDAAVVSVSTIHGGEVRNVIPSTVTFSGTIRTLSERASSIIAEKLPALVNATAAAHGCSAEVSLEPLYPVLHNDPAAAEHCVRVAKATLGPDRAPSWGLPLMGGEDFGYFSAEAPGCYVFFGTAEQDRENHMLHSSHFDFNDRALPRTITFFTRLLEDRWGLAGSAASDGGGSAASAVSGSAGPLYSEEELPSFAGKGGVPPADWAPPAPSSTRTDRTEAVGSDAVAMGHA